MTASSPFFYITHNWFYPDLVDGALCDPRDGRSHDRKCPGSLMYALWYRPIEQEAAPGILTVRKVYSRIGASIVIRLRVNVVL